MFHDELEVLEKGNFLEHFGVKGMKWGIRKDRRPRTAKAAAKKARSLSDDELRSAVNRLNLEKQYVQLTTGKSGPSRIARGRSLVNQIVISAASKSAKSYLTKEFTGQLESWRPPKGSSGNS